MSKAKNRIRKLANRLMASTVDRSTAIEAEYQRETAKEPSDSPCQANLVNQAIAFQPQFQLELSHCSILSRISLPVPLIHSSSVWATSRKWEMMSANSIAALLVSFCNTCAPMALLVWTERASAAEVAAWTRCEMDWCIFTKDDAIDLQV